LGALLESQRQIGAEHCALQAHGQRSGQVAQIRLEVQLAQLDLCIGLSGLGERRALRRGVNLASVEPEGQVRRSLDSALGLQVAEKGNAQFEITHFVRLVHGLVHKVQRAARHCDVVQRKARGGTGRFSGRLVKPCQHVIDVVAPVPQVGEVELGRIDGDGVHHRGQTENRLQFGIDINALNAQLGCTAICLGYSQIVHRQLHRPGAELHLAQADISAQLFGGDLFNLVTQQRRHHQPRQSPQRQKSGQRPDDAARPFVGCKCL
jgi:hypothetical protein